MRPGYINTALPQPLAEEVEGIVGAGLLGYRSRQEFVIDAVRRHLLYMRALEK